MEADSRNGYKYKFSVFTATLNGSALLPNVYKCLKEQTFKDFEWVIVDDGSTDNTEEICEQFVAENLFPIKYEKHAKNGGKHVAWQTAMTLMEGRYVVVADDDDLFTPNMLEIYNTHWEKLETSADYESFWEIRARVTMDGQTALGKRLPTDVYDGDYNEVNYKLGFGHVEMQSAQKIEVLRREAAVPEHFIFDEYCTNFREGVRWSRAARKYKTRFISDIVRHYLRDLSGRRLTSINKGKGRTLSKTYNDIVGEIYIQNEQRDFLLRYSIKRYVRNIFFLAYESIVLRCNVVKYIDSYMDKTLILLAYPVARLIFTYRK